MKTKTKIGFVGDLYLDCCSKEDLKDFLFQLKTESRSWDALFVAGNISTSESLSHFLKLISDNTFCKIYFVLGDYDYFHNRIETIRQQIEKLCIKTDRFSFVRLGQKFSR